VRTSFSGSGADHQIAPAAPDDFVAAVVEDAPANPSDVDLSVALDETGEVVAHAHEPGRDPAVKSGQAQPMAEVKEVRRLVGDDHRGAGLRDPGHLAKRRLGVGEMVEPAVAQYRVELPVAERQVLGFGQNERRLRPEFRRRQAASWVVETSTPTIDQSSGSQLV
jgi:hypothetical protein